MRRIERDDLAYWIWMSREEWELVYALSQALQESDLLPRDIGLNFAFYNTIFGLQKNGFHFKQIRLSDDGWMFLLGDQPRERRNELFIRLFERNEAPDYEIHLEVALRLAREHELPEDVIQVLETARSRTERRLTQRRKAWAEVPKEEVKLIMEEFREQHRIRVETMKGLRPIIQQIDKETVN